MILVEVETERKLPMPPPWPPPPPKEVEENEVKPPPPRLPIVLMEPKDVKPAIEENPITAILHTAIRLLYGYNKTLFSRSLYLSWCILPGSKGEKPAPNGGNPKPPKNVPPILLWSARPWWRRLLPKNGSSPNGSTPDNRRKFSDLDNLRAPQMIDWLKRIA